MPQSTRANPLFNFLAPKYAALWFSGGFGSMYFPGAKSFVQGDIPFLDSEIPSVNGVVTARALAKMYGAIANCGRIDGIRYLSADLVRGMAGKPSFRPDLNIVMPLSWHLGYHSAPGATLPGFGHAGLGGSIGWADPGSGMSIGFVHNRLLTPMLLDQAAFVGLGKLLRRGAEAARNGGPQVVPHFGAPYPEPPGEVAG
jgi:CubicO group peptidase (beta-lactamase class C family)